MKKKVNQKSGAPKVDVDWGQVVMKSDLAELRAATKSDVAELRTEMQTDMVGLRTEMQTDMAGLRTEMRTDMAELRTEIKSDMAELRTEMKSDMDGLRAEMKSDMTELRTEMKSDMSVLRTEMKADWEKSLRTFAINVDRRFQAVESAVDALRTEMRAMGAMLTARLESFANRMETIWRESALIPKSLDEHGAMLAQHEVRLSRLEQRTSER